MVISARRSLPLLALVVLLCAAFPAAAETGRKSSAPVVARSSPTARAAISARTAIRTFRRWLHRRYRAAHGYSVCPGQQRFGKTIFCQAELHRGRLRHMVYADAFVFHGRVRLRQTNHVTWRRHWFELSQSDLDAAFPTRGSAIVNSTAYDWSWTGWQIYSSWRDGHHRFWVAAFDGQNAGLGAFYNYRCLNDGSVVACHNRLGDAIHYSAP